MESEKGQVKGEIAALIERVEELLAVLNYVAKDLQEVSGRLKAAVQPARPQAQTVPPQPAAREVSAEEVASAFPDELRKLLKFEDKGEFITIRPTGFLGSDNFAKIADIVRNRLSGDYISAGKDSHFRVPKKQEIVEI